MRHQTGLFHVALLLTAVVLAFAGCSGDDDDDEETTADMEQELCFALVDLRIQIVELQQGPGYSTVGEIRYRLEQVQETWEDVQEQAEDVEGARTEDLETAQEDLKNAVEDLPDDMPATEARAAVQPEIDAVLSAEEALAEDMNCLPAMVPTAALNVPTTVPGEPTATVAPEGTPETTEVPAEAPTEVPTEAPTETPVPPTPEPSPISEPTATPAEPTATAVEPTPTEAQATPTPVEGALAYESDWSQGPGDWVLGPGWTVTDGALVSDGSAATSLIVPHELTQPNYAIEAEIRIETEGAPACPQVVGLIARAVAQADDATVYEAGYTAGVCSTEWEIAAVPEEERPEGEPSLERLATGPFQLDSEPHLYRFEVNDDQLRLFIDGEFAGEVTNDQYSEPGSAGIYLGGNYRVTIVNIKIFDLE